MSQCYKVTSVYQLLPLILFTSILSLSGEVYAYPEVPGNPDGPPPILRGTPRPIVSPRAPRPGGGTRDPESNVLSPQIFTPEMTNQEIQFPIESRDTLEPTTVIEQPSILEVPEAIH